MGYAADREELSALKTDMYQLTMSQVWFGEGTHEQEASYYLHWRTPPLGASYTCVAGLEAVVDYLTEWGFNDSDIAFLGDLETPEGVKMFTPEFLEYLRNMELKLDVDAVPEGTAMTTEGPTIRVTGPAIQCQIVESIMLNLMNSNSIVATRASMIEEAMGGQGTAANFALRRQATTNPDVSRAAAIGGVALTADLYDAKQLGVTPTGTMAHAFVMGLQKPGLTNDEVEMNAFRSYLSEMPHNSVLLIDTFDAKNGIDNAIKAAIEMNVPLKGVRLDSGDLYEQAWYAKGKFDEAAKTHPELFSNSIVFATDGLTERSIQGHNDRSIKEYGIPVPITGWGVGTTLGNPGPFNGGVYKVTAREQELESGEVEMVSTMKVAGVNKDDPSLPSGKASIPGEKLDVLRIWSKDGKILADMVVDTAIQNTKSFPDGHDLHGVSLQDNKTYITIKAEDIGKTELLLKPVMRRNEQGVSENVFEAPATKTRFDGEKITDLSELAEFHREQKAALGKDVTRVVEPEKAVILIHPNIQERRLEIIADTHKPEIEIEGDLSAKDSKQRGVA